MDYNKDDLDRAQKIEKQVAQWDLFAKIAPVFFLLSCFCLLAIGYLDFNTVFYIGLIMFSATAVVWWFWAIFSIRFLVRLLRKSSLGLLEVKDDLIDIRDDFKDVLKNDKNNRS